MHQPVLFICLVSAALLVEPAHANPPSSYSGQESRDIKALSSEDVQAYLSGKGLGLAKAAELNGYPGPSHVLALATELGLSAKQKQRTQSLFRNMEIRAISLGRPLVEEEHKLDQMFARKKITPKLLNQSLARLGELQARLRGAHLEAHLTQIEILTPTQIAKYVTLRGYSNGLGGAGHAGHKHD